MELIWGGLFHSWKKHADAQTLPVLFYPIFCASFWSVDVVLLELIKHHTTKFIASFYTGKWFASEQIYLASGDKNPGTL